MESVNETEYEVETDIGNEFDRARRDISSYCEKVDADMRFMVKFL
jgi:hypothetical protein